MAEKKHRITIDDLTATERQELSEETMRHISGGALYYRTGDHSTASDMKTATIVCNIDRIEVV
ncbi:MAG TPA: hypothetical protein ENN80_02685 [Candidatus Hydrogenedentes bacterium]|nr:hypothetical protein [Candidatus Hydrogenedentota bacterium]